LKSIDVLLQGAEQVPPLRRVGQLMQADLMDLQEDTLDHVARRMEDIRRRLDLGRAGPKVRDVEKGVVASLDKLIKKLEDEQQPSNGGGGSQSRSPMQDSHIAGGNARERGEEEHRIGERLGDLPPRNARKAMQQIAATFPRSTATPLNNTSGG